MADRISVSVPKAKTVKLLVANGALLQAPVYEQHHRGSNWLAVVDVDATCPGGLSRRWLNRGRGECLYDIEQLALFDAVEFGADYVTSTGRKHKLRWFGVVVAKTDGFIVVEESKSGATAVLRAKAARSSTADQANALRAQRDAAQAMAEKLDLEITALEDGGNEAKR